MGKLVKDTRFFNLRDAALFKHVLDEVFSKSHTYVDLYIPSVENPASQYDPVFGEEIPGQLVYYKFEKVPCIMEAYTDEVIVDEKGSYLEISQIEATFRDEDIAKITHLAGIHDVYSDLEMSDLNKLDSQTLVGSIVNFYGALYEIVQDAENIYIYNTRNPWEFKVQMVSNSKIDLSKRIKSNKVIVKQWK